RAPRSRRPRPRPRRGTPSSSGARWPTPSRRRRSPGSCGCTTVASWSRSWTGTSTRSSACGPRAPTRWPRTPSPVCTPRCSRAATWTCWRARTPGSSSSATATPRCTASSWSPGTACAGRSRRRNATAGAEARPCALGVAPPTWSAGSPVRPDAVAAARSATRAGVVARAVGLLLLRILLGGARTAQLVVDRRDERAQARVVEQLVDEHEPLRRVRERHLPVRVLLVRAGLVLRAPLAHGVGERHAHEHRRAREHEPVHRLDELALRRVVPDEPPGPQHVDHLL